MRTLQENKELHQLTDLLLQFAQDFCQKNQIDFSQIEDGVDFSDGNKRAEISLPIIPNGNMACIFKEAEIQFTLFNSEDMVRVARVRFSYSHTNSGSNGHSMEYVVLTKPSVRGGTEYVGFVTDLEAQAILRNASTKRGK